MNKLFSKNNLIIILALALFNFVFLCEEFCFDGVMAFLTTEKGVVYSQNIILGASVVGFLAYPVLRAICKYIHQYLVSAVLTVVCAVCMFFVYGHHTYSLTLIVGILEYLLLGIAGAAACYYTTQIVTDRKHTARIVGIAYAFGVFLQFLNNNLVKRELTQTIVIVIGLLLLAALLLFMNRIRAANPDQVETRPLFRNQNRAAAMLVLSVALLTLIFSTLDNAVTLVHASGSFNIGQWPRLILAVSGLLAGFLYDIKERRYMSIMMYLVTLIATICVVVIEMGGSFVSGLIMFYISAGFFVVFFMTSFMDLSYDMRQSSIWAGMGRAVNNLCAIAATGLSVFLLQSDNKMTILIVMLVLFAAINVTLVIYQQQRKSSRQNQNDLSKTDENIVAEASTLHLEAFAETNHFTKREAEVFAALLDSEESMQDVAQKLAISRAALYRHISSMNEKTGTKNRVSLLKSYFEWKEE